MWDLGTNYRFAGHDVEAETAAACEHYRARLRAEGLDPARYEADIESKVQLDYQRSFGLGMYDEAVRFPARPAAPPAPARGTAAHKRAEARRTHRLHGVHGLPSYGGHILSADEKRELGITDHYTPRD